MKVQIKDGVMTITMPLQAPPASASGKTNIIATTSGFTKTEAMVDGKPVSISINATIPR